MKTCINCNIKFNTYEKLCPLCQNKLKGTCKNYLFPHNKKYRNKQNIFHKILLFITLISIFIVFLIDYNINKRLVFSQYSILGMLSGYFILNLIITTYNKPVKLFLKLGPIVNIILLIWFFYKDLYLLTNYIIPSIGLLELLYNFIISLVLREKYFINYSRLLIINLLFLLIPSILSYFNMTTNNILSLICLVTFVTSILSLLIFARDSIVEELNKMINIKLDI